MPLPTHEQVGAEAALLRREQRAGAAEAGGDLVADQEHVVLAARGGRARASPSGSASCMPAAPCTSGSTITAASSWACAATMRDRGVEASRVAELRRPQHGEAQRVEHVGAEAAVADRERADGVAVVRAAEREERACGRHARGSPSTGTRSSAPARPRRRRRTRRGSAGRRRARRAPAPRPARPPRRLPLPSIVECAPRSSCSRTASSSSGTAVAERVDPQRRDGVEVAAAVDVDQLVAFGPLDDDRARSRRTRPSG